MNPFSMNLNLANSVHGPHRPAAADAACRQHKTCLAETLLFHLTSASLKIETPGVQDFARDTQSPGLAGTCPSKETLLLERLVEAAPGLKQVPNSEGKWGIWVRRVLQGPGACSHPGIHVTLRMLGSMGEAGSSVPGCPTPQGHSCPLPSSLGSHSLSAVRNTLSCLVLPRCLPRAGSCPAMDLPSPGPARPLRKAWCICIGFAPC